MVNKKISGLPTSASFAAASLLVAVVAGTTVSVNGDEIAAFVIDYDTELSALADSSAAFLTLADDATVAAMVDTLGGASSTGSGGLARAAGPTFSGVPAVPTATVGTDTTQAASTAFVKAAIDDSTPVVWLADVPPTSPNALNYEGGSVASWTEWDFASRLTAPYNATGHMVLEYAGAAGVTTWAGAYRAVPASGQYTIICKIAGLAQEANYSRVGLALLQDNTSTGDLQIIIRSINNDAANAAFYSNMTAYNTGEATIASSVLVHPHYFRYRVNGTAVVAGVSEDGIEWMEFAEQTLGYTPAYFGPVISSDVVETEYAKMRFCRVFDGVFARDSVTLGGLL